MSNSLQSALGLLGMARRAGKLQAGFERCETAIKSGKATLAFACADISAKTKKELAFLCDKHSVAFISSEINTTELSNAIGVKAGVAAVCDQGFSKRLAALLSAKREE